MPLSQIAEKLKRTEDAIKTKAVFLKIKRRNNYWTDDELRILKAIYPSQGAKIVSGMINRSYHATIYKAKLIGIRREFMEIIPSKLINGKANDFEVGFIIGLIEGEGCLSASVSAGKLDLILQIANTNRQLLEKAQEIIGGKIYCQHQSHLGHMNCKDAYKLKISSIKTLYVTLLKLQTHFIGKRKQCDLLLDICECKLSRGRHNLTTNKEKEISIQIRALNKRGVRV
jgi:hypothetical protein